MWLRSYSRFRKGLLRAIRVPIFVLGVSAVAVSASTEAPASTLDAGDQLNITVLGSRALTGPYMVQHDGNIALPTGQIVNARGLSPQQLGQRIRAVLGEYLPSLPAVSVEVVEFRPVLVVGDVRAPGPVQYFPGVTVQDVLALTGGQQLTPQELLRTEIEVVRANEELQVLLDRRMGFLITNARLLAERDDASAIDFPEEALAQKNVPHIAPLMQNEQQVFDTRRQSLTISMRILDEEIELLNTEVALLKQQIASEQKRVSLLKDQARVLEKLVKQGLAARGRAIEMQSSVTAAESSILQLTVFRARARQGIAQTQLRRASLLHERIEAVVTQLRDIEQDLLELDLRISSSQVAAKKTALLLPAASREGPPPKFSITRRYADGRRSFAASDDTPVLPGDIVRVERKAKTQRSGDEE